MTEVNYVAVAARAWAAVDPLERWVNAAADGPTPLEETITEYLAGHDPFPADFGVEARWDEAWEPAVVIERTGLDEWLVEFDDGGQAWRDHHELRPKQKLPTRADPASPSESGSLR